MREFTKPLVCVCARVCVCVCTYMHVGERANTRIRDPGQTELYCQSSPGYVLCPALALAESASTGSPAILLAAWALARVRRAGGVQGGSNAHRSFSYEALRMPMAAEGCSRGGISASLAEKRSAMQLSQETELISREDVCFSNFPAWRQRGNSRFFLAVREK